jgi:hypothetical protein
MNQAKKENEDEKADVGESGPAKSIRCDSPGGNKNNLDIEDNKEDSNQVERDWALETGIVEGKDPRLVRFLLLPRAGLVANPPGKQQQDSNQENSYTTIDSQSQI